MEKLKQLLTDYNPCNEQEDADKELMLYYINTIYKRGSLLFLPPLICYNISVLKRIGKSFLF